MTQTLHDDFEDALLDLIYDELPAERADALRAHAASCAACGASLARMTSARSLAKALPLEEPRPELTDAILARARGAMGARVEKARADAPAPRPQSENGERSVWAALAARLGSLLVGPQAAMAVVTVLMVGIGLYYFPRLRSHHAVEGGRTVDPDPTGEAGPSAEISPAAPLDLRYDPRTRRIVDAHDAPPPPHATLTPTTGPTTPSLVAPGTADGDEATGLARADEHVDAPLDSLAEGRAPAAHAHAVDVPAGRVMQDPLAGGDSMDGVASLDIAPGGTLPMGAAGGSAGAGHGARETPSPGVADLERQRAETDDAFRDQVAQLAPTANDRGPAPAAPAPPPDVAPNRQAPAMPQHAAMRAAPAPSAPPSANMYAPPPPSAPPAQAGMPMPVPAERRVTDTATLAQQNAVRGSTNGAAFGLNATGTGGTGTGSVGSAGGGGSGAYGRVTTPNGETEGVVARPPTNEPLAPQALHHRARSEAATSPQLAIRDYESLLARFPTYPESGTAMLELAELYRRTGEVGRARLYATRAEALPSSRDGARRLRVQLDQMDRAASEVRATSVEAASATSSQH